MTADDLFGMPVMLTESRGRGPAFLPFPRIGFDPNRRPCTACLRVAERLGGGSIGTWARFAPPPGGNAVRKPGDRT